VLLADFGFLRAGYCPWNARAPLRRLDGRTWGAFVSESDGLDILDASDVPPRQFHTVLDFARSRYAAVCADLTSAKAPFAVEMMRASESIFLVAAPDRASLEIAHERMRWLDSLGVADRCGLVLDHTPGKRLANAESLVGIPLCGLVSDGRYIEGLARSIAAQIRVERSVRYDVPELAFAGAA